MQVRTTGVFAAHVCTLCALNTSKVFKHLCQGLSDPYNDATAVQLSNHLPALHDETGETNFSLQL